MKRIGKHYVVRWVSSFGMMMYSTSSRVPIPFAILRVKDRTEYTRNKKICRTSTLICVVAVTGCCRRVAFFDALSLRTNSFII